MFLVFMTSSDESQCQKRGEKIFNLIPNVYSCRIFIFSIQNEEAENATHFYWSTKGRIESMVAIFKIFATMLLRIDALVKYEKKSSVVT